MAKIQFLASVLSIIILHLLTGVFSANFTLTNKCNYTVWPGLFSKTKTVSLSTTGFALAKDESKSIKVLSSWHGRIWGRTLCSEDSTGNFSCVTGDCGSSYLECVGGGPAPPATLAEFSLNSIGDQDFYDVSFVDGYNLPMVVVPQGGTGDNCAATGCPVDLNGVCPSDLKVMSTDGGDSLACKSACVAFREPQYCCTGAYDSSDTCKPSSYSEIFKNACPRAYSYPFDDETSTFICGSSPDYLITFCPSPTRSMEGNPNLCMSEPCEINQKKKRKRKIVVPIAASVAVVSVLLIAFAILWTRRKQQQKQVVQLGKKINLRGRPNRQFTYSEVLIITNNLETVIGKGGFGPVYHGYLEDTEVAVKMLSSSSVQGYKEFCAEIEFLTRIHHRNLTSLVGFCDEGDNIGLIYEYMAKGNLKEHLSDRNPNSVSWGERLRIALDAATGLEYLHNGCKPPIIHRDVKSANILLNEKLQAKLADFGLSKAFHVDNTHVTTVIAGTPGYLDPEYYATFKLKEKSDVFSFGIVLLEIITGRPVITKDAEENAHISKWVSFMLETEGDIKSIVDTRLGGDFEVNSVQKAVEIAMACASPTSIQRPTMNHVVIELRQCLVTELARLNKGRETELEGASWNCDSEWSLVGR